MFEAHEPRKQGAGSASVPSALQFLRQLPDAEQLQLVNGVYVRPQGTSTRRRCQILELSQYVPLGINADIMTLSIPSQVAIRMMSDSFMADHE